MKKTIVGFCLCFFFGMNSLVHAALLDRGGGLIYDSELNITWLQDANYAMTSGFDSDGRMPYLDAVSWVETLEYYDSVRRVTWTDWRLPFAGDPPQWFQAEQRSEMGRLYYIELGNIENHFTNSGPFVNLYMGHWAQSLPGSLAPDRAFYFAWSYGWQDTDSIYSHGIPWAVREGDVGAAPVPEPATMLLLASGLLGFAGVRRKLK